MTRGSGILHGLLSFILLLYSLTNPTTHHAKPLTVYTEHVGHDLGGVSPLSCLRFIDSMGPVDGVRETSRETSRETRHDHDSSSFLHLVLMKEN